MRHDLGMNISLARIKLLKRTDSMNSRPSTHLPGLLVRLFSSLSDSLASPTKHIAKKHTSRTLRRAPSCIEQLVRSADLKMSMGGMGGPSAIRHPSTRCQNDFCFPFDFGLWSHSCFARSILDSLVRGVGRRRFLAALIGSVGQRR